ncbi:NAD(P)-dependent oxidoreductase [Calothrix sp. UHCC 0171]|uniref:SDR family oxidoreductase n=1 Tax=Calothrix sp. UHCC 0171 TaxID=3110245 RepID=UPI002B208126|nr:NAD(P)-dependent oxidoreductase [Calothrix sp. UHCC 0171]MEA5571345.1 NAD(P)-dependent oxidoreductase [Calothrix sp. UHCC 0171]
MKKLLITGVSGFLGYHVCQLASVSTQPQWEIYGTYFSHDIQIPGIKLIKTNLAHYQSLKQIFAQIQPDAVIHTAAISQPNYCQNHPEESHAVNVTASINIAELCAEKSIPLAFTSTDLVFDGKNAPYKETDAVNPVNLYGEQKVLAEQGMLTKYPLTAVCRMPLMFGKHTPTATSFLQNFIQTLTAGKELNLFIDEFRTPASGNTAATGLLLVLTKNFQGIINLGGKERISRYDFGQLMVKTFNLPVTGLKACRQADVKMSAPRPQDVSLDSSQAFAWGYQPLSIQQELEAIRNAH